MADTEQIGTSSLENLISYTGCAVPVIERQSSAMSWDGHIEVYSSKGNKHPKATWIYDLPVQVKGHLITKYDKRLNYFDIELSDLEHYRIKGGTLFFKICADEASREETIYYKALLPGDAQAILGNARGEKTVSVHLDPFPTDIPMVEAVLLAFAKTMRDKRGEETRWADCAPTEPLPPCEEEEPEPPRSPYLYDAGTVGFHGRGGELAQLRGFLDDERRFCWWGVVGEGGVGKSRLAFELCNQLNDTGDWYARRLDVNGLRELPELTRDEFNDRFPYRTLLVVDYAQQHAAALGAWMARLAARDFGRREKLRLLLLERADMDKNGEAPWEKELLAVPNGGDVRRARYAGLMELLAPPVADLRRIMLDFAAYLRGEDAALPPLGEGEADALLAQLARMPEVKGRPLFAMLLADAALHRKLSPGWTWESLLDFQLDRERELLVNRMGASAGNELLQDAVFSLRLVATVLGVSGDPTRETIDELCPDELAEVREAAREAHVKDETLLRRLGLLDASLERICALRPDLFGEYLVLDFLRAAREEERDRLFAAILTDWKATETFFLRLLRDFGELIQTAESFEGWLFPKAVPDDERADTLVRILRTLFVGAQIEAAATDPNGGKTYVFANTEASRASLVRRMKTYVDALREDGVPAASALHDYADALYFMGDYPTAAKHYLRVLAIKEKRALDSPDTAATYNNLALTYQDMGDYPKALEFCKKALAIRETVLGKEHPDTAMTYNNLAGVYYAMGDYPKALEYHKKAQTIRETVLGKEHPDTAATYNNLALTYQDMGDYPKALEYHEKAQTIRETVLGKEHPDTAATYNNLAGVYYAMGDYPKALEYHKKAQTIRETVLGKEHPDTATTYNNLANVYYATGDYPKALEYYKKALAIDEKMLGKKHPNTAATCNNLAGVYNAMGDYPKALEYHKKSLAIREMVLGKEHPDTAQTYFNLANVYHAMGDYSKALVYYEKALTIREAVLGKEHPDTAATCNNLASVYNAMGDYPKALEYHKKSLAIREMVLGKEHPDTAQTYYNLALTYKAMGDYPKALEYYEKTLNVRKKVLGEEHPDTAATYNNVGVLYLYWQKPTEAVPWLRRALAIWEAVLGTEHPYTKTARANLEAAERLAEIEKEHGSEVLAKIYEQFFHKPTP